MQDAKLKQISFAFEVPNLMGADDYIVTDCNKTAFSMVQKWPNWPNKGLVVYGPEGCGKSHLAHLLAEKIKQQTQQLNCVAILNSAQVKMNCVPKLAETYQHLIVENLMQKVDNEALFHLFNIYQDEPNRSILWTAHIAPNQIHFSLKDLQSRLNMLPCVAIERPDDKMMQMIVVKLFNDRQLMISPEILEYIVVYAKRSFSYIQKLVEEIDAVSLAYHMSVNHFVVKKAMELVDTKEDKQRDLFDEW